MDELLAPVPLQVGSLHGLETISDNIFSGPTLDLDMVPQLPRISRRLNAGCVFEADPTGLAAEQFRLMQRRLANHCPRGATALLTSPGAGDGKSLNTHNLAWALAEAGHNTLLLELDLRRPTQASYNRAQAPHTVLDILTGELPPEAVVRRVGGVPLFYIGLEKPAPDPTRLLRSRSLRQLLGWARRNFEWVIIDGPPVLAISDVEEILPSVDLVMMIARERVTPRAMLERAAERLGKRLNFVIFNDVEVSGHYGYGYE
jgi:Mrp family chromosome partitioning ATPase